MSREARASTAWRRDGCFVPETVSRWRSCSEGRRVVDDGTDGAAAAVKLRGLMYWNRSDGDDGGEAPEVETKARRKRRSVLLVTAMSMASSVLLARAVRVSRGPKWCGIVNL